MIINIRFNFRYTIVTDDKLIGIYYIPAICSKYFKNLNIGCLLIKLIGISFGADFRYELLKKWSFVLGHQKHVFMELKQTHRSILIFTKLII